LPGPGTREPWNFKGFWIFGCRKSLKLIRNGLKPQEQLNYLIMLKKSWWSHHEQSGAALMICYKLFLFFNPSFLPSLPSPPRSSGRWYWGRSGRSYWGETFFYFTGAIIPTFHYSNCGAKRG
jgi:hypothetical protein